MSENDAADESLDALFRSAEPDGAAGFERRVGLGNVLAAVLGTPRAEARVGRFVIERKVGRGGMGVVYAARDPESGAPVAVKLLERDDPAARLRFEREAELLKTLVHPRIVRYLDHGTTDDGIDYLVMEWLEGQDLGCLLEAGPLGVRDVVQLGIEAARGLAVANAAGVVHRDVKPKNLFLVQSRLPDLRVIDFGVARPEAPGTRLTASGAVLGTPGYMAPEQLRGNADARTDVYGLGATLFECLTGRPPFRGDNPGAVLVAVMAEPVPSLAALRPEIPASLEGLITRMLAKDPRERPMNMQAVITELSDVLSSPASRRARAVVSSKERPRAEVSEEVGPGSESGTDRPAIFGRARELGLLLGLAAESAEDEVARAALISGDDGLGRTHLARAFANSRELSRSSVVFARSNPEQAGVPFALLGRIVDASSRDLVRLHAPVARRLERVQKLLSELKSPSGRAAWMGGDLLRLADQLRLAWLELMSEHVGATPCVIVVDDAHFSDLSSWRFLGRALSELEDRPLCLVATSKPGRPAEALSHGLPPEASVTVPLGPLRPRAARRLAQSARSDLAGQALDLLVQRASGNPSHLMELLRRGDGPIARPGGSAAELAWNRLSAFDPDSRRVLRAAAIVGSVFWTDLVAELLGAAPSSPMLTDRIEMLIRSGELARDEISDLRGHAQLRFQHELLRLAALQLCSDDELRHGHRVTAHWLASRSQASSASIAGHLVLADAKPEAATHFLCAARAALAGDDPDLADKYVEDGLSCHPDPELAALFSLVTAENAYFRGELSRARQVAEAAVESLPAGSAAMLRGASLAVTAAGQLGENGQVRSVLERVLATPTEPEARDEKIVCLCRGVTQLSALDPALTRPFVAAIDALVEQASPGPEARAWIERVRVWQGAGRDLDRAIDGTVRAHQAHVEAGDPRSAVQMQIHLGSHYTSTGAFERARAVIDDALRDARRLGADDLESWAAYAEGKLSTEVSSLAETRDVLTRVIEASAASPRIRGGARVYLGVAALRAGENALALRSARAALEEGPAPVVELGARAVLARGLRAARAAGWERELELLQRRYEEVGTLIELETLVLVALAEGALAAGDRHAARGWVQRAKAKLTADAETLADPSRRSQLWTRPHLNARVLELMAGIEAG